MMFEEQPNEFNRSTSPMMWEQFPYKQSQPQLLPQRKSRGQQTQKTQLHGTYTIFWTCTESQKSIRYDITLNSDKTIRDFILDATDFFSQNSSSFVNLYNDIDNVKLYIAKENGSKSTTYPPVSIHEVPTVFTLFKNQRKRFFLLELISEEDNENEQANSNSTNSSEMLIARYPKDQNYRNLTKTADKITSIYSDKMKNSKIYNNSFHSQTNSYKESPPQPTKHLQQNQQKKNKKFCLCFCSE